MRPEAFLDALAAGAAIAAPVVILVAHPDDECCWLATIMSRCRRFTLVHLTDGAPRDGDDARQAGFADWREYRAARARELDRALARLDLAPRRISLGCADQAAHRMRDLVPRVAEALAGAEIAVTHAFEGGHPDHDACALALQAACARLGERAPARFECAGYFAAGEGLGCGRFLDGDQGIVPPADAGERAARLRALDAFETQAATLAPFRDAPERVRMAKPASLDAPPFRAAAYESWFPLRFADWRDEMRARLAV